MPAQRSQVGKHRGACSELIACSWLLEHGWEVFRNVSQHGDVDIVAMKGDEILFLDVKSVNGDQNYRNRSGLTEHQLAKGIKALYVFDDNTCEITNGRPQFSRERVETCRGCGKPLNRSRRLWCSDFCAQRTRKATKAI